MTSWTIVMQNRKVQVCLEKLEGWKRNRYLSVIALYLSIDEQVEGFAVQSIVKRTLFCYVLESSDFVGVRISKISKMLHLARRNLNPLSFNGDGWLTKFAKSMTKKVTSVWHDVGGGGEI